MKIGSCVIHSYQRADLYLREQRGKVCVCTRSCRLPRLFENLAERDSHSLEMTWKSTMGYGRKRLTTAGKSVYHNSMRGISSLCD